jgi:beta-lactamase class A/LysM repeat protein
VLAVLILASLFGGRSLVANLADGAQHVVKPGETLGAIAAQYGVTVDQLTGLNGITDPDRLSAGQTLKLPTTARVPEGSPSGAPPPAQASSPPASGNQAQASAKPTGSPSEYAVQPGDTLSGIAKSLGVSLKALMDANAELADPDRLRVGQKLTVPAGATGPAPAQASAKPTGASTTNQSNQPGTASSSAPTTQQTTSAPNPATDDVNAALDRLAQQYNVDPALVRALAWIESDGKPYKPDSAAGVGHLTVTDKTFEYIQQALVKRTLDRANPIDNLEAGIAYVAAMLKWGGEEPKGLAGFLQGPGSVRTNGVRPAIEEQVKRILVLRDRLKTGAPAPTTAGPSANPPAGPAQSAPAATTTGAGAGAGRTAQTAPASTASSTARSTTTSSDARLAAGDSASLMARTIGAARSVAGASPRIGISGRNLVSGERLEIGADQSFPAASVGKLGLLVEAYRQTSSGTLTLNEVQRADLKAMIVASDNDAANRLMELLSTRAVNANLQALGLIGTKLVNPFGSAQSSGRPANVTTPGDMTRLMELLATEQLVNAQASREMRGLLLQSNDGSKLRRGLPPEARLAHKSGWSDGVANDVGIVTHPQGSYILSVFTEGIEEGETANQTIAAVAEAVHALWGPKQQNPDAAVTRPTR